MGGCKDQAFIFLWWIDFVIETAKDLHQGRGHLPAGRERPGVYAVGLVALPHRCLEMARTGECTSPAFKLKNFTTKHLLMFAGQPTWITYLFYQLQLFGCPCCVLHALKCKGNSAWYCTDTLAFVCFACCLLGFVSISSGLPKGIWLSSFIFRVYSSNFAGDAFYILIEGQVRLQLDVKIFAEALTSSRTWIIWIRSVSSLMVGRWPNWRQHRKNHPFLVLPPEDLHEFSSMFQHVAVLHQWLSKSLVENHL